MAATNNGISGHAEGTVNGTAGAFVLCNLILLVLMTLYLAWRVYYCKKYITLAWAKEYGISERPEALKQDIEMPSFEYEKTEQEKDKTHEISEDLEAGEIKIDKNKMKQESLRGPLASLEIGRAHV